MNEISRAIQVLHGLLLLLFSVLLYGAAHDLLAICGVDVLFVFYVVVVVLRKAEVLDNSC